MMKRLMCLALLLIAGLAPAHAHGPTPKKVDEKIAIAAPPDRVWNVLADFGGIARWHPAVKRSKASDGNKVGSERELELDGGTLTESLDEYDAGRHSYSYRLGTENVKALPVSSYFASIEVQPADAGSVVSWSGRFYRGDTSNFPPDDLNDEAAVNAMTAFFQEGLTSLKKRIEHP